MRIFCIGRNYAAHAAELKNELPTEPVVFIKPESCLVQEDERIMFPRHGKKLHHEAELVVRIGQDSSFVTEAEAVSLISHLGIGLDLTLRDVQEELKTKKLPWEKAKAFDYSSPVACLQTYKSQRLDKLHIACEVNGELRQDGDSSQMIFSIPQIISHLSSIWALQAGDLIYTGTPSGVGSLSVGDEIRIYSDELGSASWRICSF
jgi:acylpyruvate hydrolase